MPGGTLIITNGKIFQTEFRFFLLQNTGKKAKSNAIKNLHTYKNTKYEDTQRRLTYLISSTYPGTHWGGTVYLHALQFSDLECGNKYRSLSRKENTEKPYENAS